MAETKYLITVDSETGVPTKVEKLDEGGEPTPIDLSKLSLDVTDAAAPAITDGEDFSISFPSRPPGRAR